jgi:hypothetical protein
MLFFKEQKEGLAWVSMITKHLPYIVFYLIVTLPFERWIIISLFQWGNKTWIFIVHLRGGGHSCDLNPAWVDLKPVPFVWTSESQSTQWSHGPGGGGGIYHCLCATPKDSEAIGLGRARVSVFFFFKLSDFSNTVWLKPLGWPPSHPQSHKPTTDRPDLKWLDLGP